MTGKSAILGVFGRNKVNPVIDIRDYDSVKRKRKEKGSLESLTHRIHKGGGGY